MRTVGESEKDHEAKDDRRDAPDDIDPLPPIEAKEFRMLHDHPINGLGSSDFKKSIGKLGANDLGDRRGDEEYRESAGAVTSRKPMRKIDKDAWEEPGFREAEEKAHHVKLKGGGDRRSQCGHQSPGKHDAANPLARTPTFDDEGTRNFKEKIPQEEHPGPRADDIVVESRQVAPHREHGDGDIRAIDKRDHVTDEEQRQQAPVRFAPGAIKRRLPGRGGCRLHSLRV